MPITLTGRAAEGAMSPEIRSRTNWYSSSNVSMNWSKPVRSASPTGSARVKVCVSRLTAVRPMAAGCRPAMLMPMRDTPAESLRGVTGITSSSLPRSTVTAISSPSWSCV